MEKGQKELRHWQQEKRLIPKMVRIYCRGNHKKKRKEEGIKRNELCKDCQMLLNFAIHRLDVCPFKKNKEFCSFCKIHCYQAKPQYQEEMKKVMRYAGPRLLLTNPVFSISHVHQLIKHKKQNRKKKKEAKNDR